MKTFRGRCRETKQTWPQFNSHEIIKDTMFKTHWTIGQQRLYIILVKPGSKQQWTTNIYKNTYYWFLRLCDIPPRLYSNPRSQRLHPQAVVPGKRLRSDMSVIKGLHSLTLKWHFPNLTGSCIRIPNWKGWWCFYCGWGGQIQGAFWSGHFWLQSTWLILYKASKFRTSGWLSYLLHSRIIPSTLVSLIKKKSVNPSNTKGWLF